MAFNVAKIASSARSLTISLTKSLRVEGSLRPRKMCNCMVLDVTAIFFWITAFLKKLPFLAKGLSGSECIGGWWSIRHHISQT